MENQKKKGGNTSIKNNHFALWLSKKIGKKKEFQNRFCVYENGIKIKKWNDRDLYRWCHKRNFPKIPVLAELINDIHLYTGIDKCTLMTECLTALQKDYKDFKLGKKRS